MNARLRKLLDWLERSAVTVDVKRLNRWLFLLLIAILVALIAGVLIADLSSHNSN